MAGGDSGSAGRACAGPPSLASTGALDRGIASPSGSGILLCFRRAFTRLVGEAPLHYLKRLRLNPAAIRMRSTNDKLSAIAARAGYESAAAFTKAFKKQLGKTAGEYRRAH
jgi:methylphosphotriester-DNA--protein-cysteine methyltransferase